MPCPADADGAEVYGLFWASAFVGMGILGAVILGIWLTQPDADLDIRLIVIGFLGPIGFFAAPAQAKISLSPYYALIGVNGFATFGGEPILWRDVVAVTDRTYRGQSVGLRLVLSRPLRWGRIMRFGSMFGLLNSFGPPNTTDLPKGLSPMPIDELRAIFVKRIEAYRGASQPASQYWPA